MRRFSCTLFAKQHFGDTVVAGNDLIFHAIGKKKANLQRKNVLKQNGKHITVDNGSPKNDVKAHRVNIYVKIFIKKLQFLDKHLFDIDNYFAACNNFNNVNNIIRFSSPALDMVKNVCDLNYPLKGEQNEESNRVDQYFREKRILWIEGMQDPC